jgi:hypothetical protein
MRLRTFTVPSVTLVLFGFLIAGSSVATTANGTAQMSDESGFVGSWTVIARPDQGPPFLSLGTIGADGALIVSPPPAQPSPDAPGGVLLLSTGHGA